MDGKEPKYGLTVLGTGNNKKAFYCGASVSQGVEEEIIQLMYTPETSGGLLAAIPPGKTEEVLKEFEARELFCRVIGTVEEGSGIVVSDQGFRLIESSFFHSPFRKIQNFDANSFIFYLLS